MVHKLTDINYSDTIGKNSCLVLIYFYGDHCGPCRQAAPAFEDISGKFGDRVLFLSMSTDNNIKVPQALDVEFTPTFLFIKDNMIVDRMQGFKENLREELATAILKHI